MDIMKPREVIIAELVRRRQRLGLTQREMAEMSQISQSTIAQFESGRHDPRLSTVQRYAKILDVTERIRAAIAEGEKTAP